MLRATNLKKKFKSRMVVNDVSIEVKPGEIVGLLGPNGAGKSTTFYMLIGLIKPDFGEIYLDNINITKLPMHTRCRLGMGYLPQEASIFRKMTVFDNIVTALEFRNISKEERNKKALTLINEFKLDHVASSYAYTLSGGEVRRVEIARCLACDPKFVLLDEPFANIDPVTVQDIQTMVFSLKKKGIGVLITDHSVRETLRITDHAYVISEGKVLTFGLPEEIVKNSDAINKFLGKGFSL